MCVFCGSAMSFKTAEIPNCLAAPRRPYVDLVVAEALLHLVEQAAVCQLAEGRQVVIGSRRHQLYLSDIQG